MADRKRSTATKSSLPPQSARHFQSESSKAASETEGFYRVHLLHAESEEWLTFYVPLDGALRLHSGGRRPWLGKALWDGEEILFELAPKSDKVARLIWSDGTSDMALELGSGPLRLGNAIRLRSMDDPDDPHWDYSLRGLNRV